MTEAFVGGSHPDSWTWLWVPKTPHGPHTSAGLGGVIWRERMGDLKGSNLVSVLSCETFGKSLKPSETWGLLLLFFIYKTRFLAISKFSVRTKLDTCVSFSAFGEGDTLGGCQDREQQ